MDKNILFMLSLCQKAGKVVTGEDSCLSAIANGKAFLIIQAEDASENTKKRFSNKALYYNVPIITAGNKEVLSKAVGKANRPTIVITDQGLSEKIRSLLADGQ